MSRKIYVRCSYKLKMDPYKLKHKIVKRSSLPKHFQEDEDIELLDTIEEKVPEPKVLMEVRQNGELIDDMVTVIPGTPLIMEIKLNNETNEIYGLNINYLQVTDMAEMSETILFRGCTVDPYLFENFNLTETNSLQSKFRAFKFPNTSFVQFRANVQICLKKCTMAQCTSSGANKQERKRRDLSHVRGHLYEVHSSFILNFNDSFHQNKEELEKLQQHLDLLHSKSLHLTTLK